MTTPLARHPAGATVARIATALLAVAALALLTARPASGHSALVGASPAPDETVGGTIDVVELAFNESVSQATITVSFNDQPLAGATTVANGEILRFQLDQALSMPGRYQISYEMISFDADFTTSAYFFTFDPAAPQPDRISVGEPTGVALSDDGSSGTNWLLVAGSGAAAVAAVVVLALFVWRLDAQRETTGR